MQVLVDKKLQVCSDFKSFYRENIEWAPLCAIYFVFVLYAFSKYELIYKSIKKKKKKAII